VRVQRLYGYYSTGHLLRAGGLVDQPLWYLAAMRLADSVVKEHQREEQEAARRDMESKLRR